MPAAWKEDPDRALAEAIAQGDGRAMEAFISRHQRWMRSVVYAVLGDVDGADDVLQQVWLNVWRRAGRLKDAENPSGWLYRLARNAAVDAGRRTARRKKASQGLRARASGRTASGPDAQQEVSVREQHRAVLEAIGAMPEIYREVLVLRHVEDFSYRQIADLLGVPVDTVETRLVRARRMLRERFKDGEWR